MALAFSSLRVGKKYKATNYGEAFHFELMRILEADDFLLKDILTMEKFLMSDIIRFGKGPDFDLREIP